MHAGTASRLRFAGDIEDSKSTLGRTLCVFGSHTFVPISWMSKKQTSVSHTSTESEVISLGAGLRLDGLPALDLWDVVIEELHSSKNTHRTVRDHCRNEVRSTNSNTIFFEVAETLMNCRRWIKLSQIHVLLNVKLNEEAIKMHIKGRSPTMRRVTRMLNSCQLDHVATNANSSQCKAHLYIFEDKEAVNKMIIKGRSLTMRHVTRTHRVALDWLFDRINIEPKVQIKYVDTQKQLADLLTEVWRVMKGTIFFNCWTSWFSRCSLTAISLELVAAKQRSVCLISLNQKQPSSLGSDASVVLVYHHWIESLCQEAAGNWRETQIKTEQRVLKRGMKTFWSRKLRETATRWWCVCDSSGSRGKLHQCVEKQLDKARWDYHNMQISVCLHVGKVFENLRQKLHWSRDCLCRQRWNHQFISGFNTKRIWSQTRKPTSRSSRCCPILRWDWSWNNHSRFWMHLRWYTFSLLGWDLLCVMIKSSSGRKQKCMSTQSRSCVWERCIVILKRMQYGKVRSKNFNNRTSIEWNISAGFTTIEILWEIEKDLNAWQINPEQLEGINSIHVDVERHWFDTEWQTSERLREKIPARTLVIPWSWKGWKMIWNVLSWARRKMGQWSKSDDWTFCRKWWSHIPRYKCAQPRNLEEKRRKKYGTFLCVIRK